MSYTENPIGFLKPNGTLIECESWEHMEKACDIADEIGISYKNKLDAEIALQLQGYIVIRARDIYGRIGQFDNNGGRIHLSKEQKDWLEANYEDFPEEKRKSTDEIFDWDR